MQCFLNNIENSKGDYLTNFKIKIMNKKFPQKAIFLKYKNNSATKNNIHYCYSESTMKSLQTITM